MINVSSDLFVTLVLHYAVRDNHIHSIEAAESKSGMCHYYQVLPMLLCICDFVSLGLYPQTRSNLDLLSCSADWLLVSQTPNNQQLCLHLGCLKQIIFLKLSGRNLSVKQDIQLLKGTTPALWKSNPTPDTAYQTDATK